MLFTRVNSYFESRNSYNDARPRMVSVVHRHKHPAASRHPEKKKSRRDRSDTRHRELRLEREESCLPELTVGKRRDVNSQLPLLDPVDRPVPMQLISVLKLKSFAEEMRRAADIEIHDPSVCGECVEQQASLALDTFIQRKRTLLDSLTLEDRLQTHLCNRDTVCLLGELLRNLPKLSDAPQTIWEELQAKERGLLPSGVTQATPQEQLDPPTV
ncbi:uncharacterized protein C8orf48-like isoform X2 [Hypomesus transpacificus]|uniref:uncharacterized protein C8orf48-like isoform X2 n=1 Tax=Hypomesus transpacificus TaxID=137520 RepID=UPI001F083850|nr:uncharacterized protein C8orf48-like isoform X2 [Hypomesus transpacificus]